MRYPEHLIADMRADLVRYGVEETKTPEAVDAVLAPGSGTVLMVVNSYCGCAAGKARPALGMALRGDSVPQKAATVFAGGDVEATDRARGYFTGYPPSSPSVALLRDGKLVHMLQRSDIEHREAVDIASELKRLFDKYCEARSK